MSRGKGTVGDIPVRSQRKRQFCEFYFVKR